MEKYLVAALKGMRTDDYQDQAKTGLAPKPNVPVEISVWEEGDVVTVDFEFRSTSEAKAEKIVFDMMKPFGDFVLGIYTGEMEAGWVSVTVELA